MSGIVGILNHSGAPVDFALLRVMTDSLTFRGPDAREVWRGGQVGFGHAMLRTTREAEAERQPANLREELWITADVRVDARSNLISELRAKGREVPGDAPDSTLILHAYDVWGEECVEHLLGDFAFAIWDTRQRQLFCARDHFGVKPFFYAQNGGCLIFSNTLGCVRLHPGISDRLNDLAIADFLLFDSSQDLSTTVFADVQRLPPAHTLVCSRGEVRFRRYWELPIEEPIRYARPAEYVEHFRALFTEAVSDRLRVNSAGVLMSGGLDSTSVAGIAREVLARRGGRSGLCAYTVVYDSVVPDEERRFAALAAEHLSIPVDFLAADKYGLYERWDIGEIRTPEPNHDPLAAFTSDQQREMCKHHRVILTGLGGDPVFSGSVTSHLAKLVRQKRFAEAVGGLSGYLLAEGRFSRLYLRTRWRVLRKRSYHSEFPVWLKEEFARRLDLRTRWQQPGSGGGEPEHPYRPEAYQLLQRPAWPYTFESLDPEVYGYPLEFCHPFFDVPLASFLLRLPTLPWSCDKELLRVAMKGVLPDRIRLRKKTPLRLDPVTTLVQKGDTPWLHWPLPRERLAGYIEWSRIPPVNKWKTLPDVWRNLRPYTLGFWLHSLTATRPSIGS
jgi:asparagine synthase (glutamine-hydrolysing)